jgi:SAM-dependent methyltransferase
MYQEDLTLAESHFAFGRNWAEYAAKITEAEIRAAEAGLVRLLGGDRLDGKRFLDIGSGSGLHSLAALRLGAREVVAIDIDADSVATTHAVLSRFFPQGPWRCQEKSVFELKPEEWGDFDVVYSWGYCTTPVILTARWIVRHAWSHRAVFSCSQFIVASGWIHSGAGKSVGMPKHRQLLRPGQGRFT